MKKKIWKGAALLLAAGLLAGCGSSTYDMASADYATNAVTSSGASYDYYDDYDYAEDVYEVESTYSGSTSSVAATGSGEVMDLEDEVTDPSETRKLITTVSLTVETYDFDELLSDVEARTKALGGYVETSNVNNRSNGSRYASYTIRIPEKKVDEFADTVSEESNVTNRSRNVEDVTLSYVDMQSRKSVLETEEKRLLEMLEESSDVSTMITVETRLSEVQADIESMESQLRTYDNLISYSRIYLDISEVKVYTVVEEEEETVWERMSHGFMDSLTDLGDFLTDFAVWIVSNLPVLLFIALIIFGIVMIIRGIVKSAQKKAAAKQAARAAARQAYYPQPMGYYVPGGVQPMGYQPAGTPANGNLPASAEGTANHQENATEHSPAPASEDAPSKEENENNLEESTSANNPKEKDSTKNVRKK